MNTLSKNQEELNKIASTHLGQAGGLNYSSKYDPTLLVKLPRNLNREAYNIDSNFLPFVGYDIWNAYEVSGLTSQGLPVSGIIKLVYPSNSEFHVESKSLKLYLNSFNLSVFARTVRDTRLEIERVVKRDLTALLGVEVKIFFATGENLISLQKFKGYSKLIGINSLDYLELRGKGADLLTTTSYNGSESQTITSDLLRSNCRVTNQPDWGDLYIYLEGTKHIHHPSLAQYLVSHRTVNHFHEEVVEMIYMDLSRVFQPKKLMVAALYTRRGGIDINPIRATHEELIPKWVKSRKTFIQKTLRQ